jgi:hypothetical protein
VLAELNPRALFECSRSPRRARRTYANLARVVASLRERRLQGNDYSLRERAMSIFQSP